VNSHPGFWRNFFCIDSFIFQLSVNQFHQHFLHTFFVQKSFFGAFSRYVLDLAKNSYKKCVRFIVDEIDSNILFSFFFPQNEILSLKQTCKLREHVEHVRYSFTNPNQKARSFFIIFFIIHLYDFSSKEFKQFSLGYFDILYAFFW